MSSRPFYQRHIGPNNAQQKEMLQSMGLNSLEELVEKTVPKDIVLTKELDLPDPVGEGEYLAELKALVSKNQQLKSFIGMGYYGTITPPAVQRHILENPGWYTAYTPYQAEISQGRLEILFYFQTVVAELSGLPITGASLLDESTAAAETMSMFFAYHKSRRKKPKSFALVGSIFPQTVAVVKSKAKWLDINIEEYNCISDVPTDNPELFGVLVQNPDGEGKVRDLSEAIAKLQEAEIQVGVAGDLLAQCILKNPGQMGADAAVGSTQRFGLAMGNGGPHAGWLAAHERYTRLMPGRIIGLSKDVHGNPAYRMALGTREQHIRREKATSNICTAQVLPAVLSTAYAIYHGPQGLQEIALRTQNHAQTLAQSLQAAGVEVRHTEFFDTLKIAAHDDIFSQAVAAGYNLRRFADGDAGISLDECTTAADVAKLAQLFGAKVVPAEAQKLPAPSYLDYPVFKIYHSEHALIRFLKKLQSKDISLVHSMIPLGSCTMKLNAAAEMIPLSWPELGNVHPFAPADQKEGYNQLITELENLLAEITHFAGVSLMPNSGAQGEYTGLVVIRAYLESIGQGHRNIALIPASAHGTNPASAVMAGLTCVTVKCDEKGNVDVEHLKVQAEKHQENLAAIMVTYPSTHGVFEESIREICEITHKFGGQVYMDGANMNAQVALTAPGFIGADVCHLNLHKTFAIPHGGGGPGSGPIGVAEHLVPFLPQHPVTDGSDLNTVSAAPWGSASILPITYGYIRMMGADGLKKATQNAILNANYLMHRLAPHYPILYTGSQGYCAHEFIVDCREFKRTTGVEAGDIARRLMDYGFHAPTVSFPVGNTLMFEPTESEPLEELERYAQAMIAIRQEIAAIAEGKFAKDNNLIYNAPHTLNDLLGEWEKPYGREEAAFPLEWLREGKVWPAVGRIDNAYGDRNLVCSCFAVR
ncbi:MAG: aminomethyl-transferring glycine dehydrogenase [Fibrobacter sp.]|nr:aminomethyl-transferring glycine dehydrogenase [Fibrobacter sp.]